MPEQPDPFELFGLEPVSPGTSPQPPLPESTPSAISDRAEPVMSIGADGVHDGVADDAGEFVSLKGGGGDRRGGRWALLLGVPLLLLALIVVVAGFWVKGKIDPGSPGEEVSFTVSKGATTSQIATALAEKKIVTNATVFEWYVKWKGVEPFQAGDYEGLRVNSSMADVVDILKAGPPPPKTVSFLVREGLWISEFKKLALEKFPTMDPLALDAALKNTHPALQPAGSTNLEGFLFPATYEIAQQNVGDAQKLIDQMLAAFDRVSQAEGLPDASAKLKGVAGTRTITPYEALIVASLVESEAKVDEDRPKIARVIYNRLAKGETLGIDASVLYAIQNRKTTLTDSDLKTDSPYNTRLKRGLPPTPINSPGQASINAALNPAPGDWIFYVLTDKEGRHYFTNNQADFSRAVADAKAQGDLLMMPTGETRLAAVIGDPVRHSLSPTLMNAAFAATGLDWTYVALEVAATGLPDALVGVRALGISGLSVTMPHKEAAAACADVLTPAAERLGAVNCLVNDAGTLTGHNTDGEGFVRSLAHGFGFDPQGKHCVVFGAGGSARSIILAVAEAGAEEIIVVNRTLSRAERAAALAGDRGEVVSSEGVLSDLADADLIVNATSVGMGASADGPVPFDPSVLHEGQVLVDIVYKPLETPLISAARARGVTVANGVPMLAHQAAVQFELWTGVDAPIDVMLASVAEQLR